MRGRGRSRKTWEQCVRDDMKLLGCILSGLFLGICGLVEGLDLGQTSNLTLVWKNEHFQNR